jgi:hypothetical protein
MKSRRKLPIAGAEIEDQFLVVRGPEENFKDRMGGDRGALHRLQNPASPIGLR